MSVSWKVIAFALIVLFVVACGRESREASDDGALSFDGADARSGHAEHGARLADVLGCTGCHRKDFSGGPFNEGWMAPNVSLLVADYDHDQLELAIRQGIALDGRKLRMMPSEMYRFLSDADMRALSTYLLALDPVGEPQPPFEPFPSDLADWEADGYTNGHALGLEWAASSGPLDVGPDYARGRYLALNLCTECHNNQLQGYPNFTPDLTIIAAYSDAEFKRLLREGKGNVREQLGLMSLVAPARFPHLSDAELRDLSAYLRRRSETLLDG